MGLLRLSTANLLKPTSSKFAGRAFYSSASNLNPLKASEIKVNKTTSPKPLIPNKDLVFGHAFSDHMFEVDWQSDKGWINPEIKAYQPIVLDPSASVFHYAFCCFEGMKAYKGPKGEIRLFRPDLNMARL
ncbi:D-aminoacid aminotransferase-like PLP-dependent enzyme, partial [Conidiobolus coronatus NRRL 28638]